MFTFAKKTKGGRQKLEVLPFLEKTRKLEIKKWEARGQKLIENGSWKSNANSFGFHSSDLNLKLPELLIFLRLRQRFQIYYTQ